MIKFYRHLRRNLMETGKTSKYLKYAIGEIVLVVIGILIALSINNWNSHQKDKAQETKILLQLKEGLAIDKNKMKAELNNLVQIQRSIKTLERLLEHPQHKYNPELDTLFGPVYGMKNIKLNKAFYEDLKTSGIQLIKDENIREKVVVLFEDNYAEIMGLENFELHVNELIRPYYLRHFKNIEFSVSAHPINYDQIWKDSYYKNIVNYRYITLEKNHIAFFNRTIKDIDLLISDIEKYLEAKL
ncbi:DUF6090 family protein [Geojedonia litorea]|uniref:DUF6090 family protein n=1 Tax=Geojedonia litorea TaxID=1268269 RepID=A0ABV9N1E0_9FLAO